MAELLTKVGADQDEISEAANDSLPKALVQRNSGRQTKNVSPTTPHSSGLTRRRKSRPKAVLRSSPPQTPVLTSLPTKRCSVSKSPSTFLPKTLEHSLNPWTIAALTKSKKSRVQTTSRVTQPESGNGYDEFTKAVRPDSSLQTRVLVCRISLEDIVAGQIELSHDLPTCDLMEFLEQYSS